jgi:hypothetical protein
MEERESRRKVKMILIQSFDITTIHFINIKQKFAEDGFL